MPETDRQKSLRLAKAWGVSDSTTKRWIDLNWPVDDEKALAVRMLQDNRCHAHTRRKAHEILAGQTKSPEQQDAEVREAEVLTHKTALGIAEYLESQVARYQRDQTQCEAIHDVGGVEYAVKQLVMVGTALVRIRKELRKMGEEAGQNVSRDEVRQIVAAFGSRASLGLSRLVERLSVELTGASESEIPQKIEAIVVMEVFVEPFRRASSIAAASGMPAWVVEAITKAVEDHVEVEE